jgi:hypothetical protein
LHFSSSNVAGPCAAASIVAATWCKVAIPTARQQDAGPQSGSGIG